MGKGVEGYKVDGDGEDTSNMWNRTYFPRFTREGKKELFHLTTHSTYFIYG